MLAIFIYVQLVQIEKSDFNIYSVSSQLHWCKIQNFCWQDSIVLMDTYIKRLLTHRDGYWLVHWQVSTIILTNCIYIFFKLSRIKPNQGTLMKAGHYNRIISFKIVISCLWDDYVFENYTGKLRTTGRNPIHLIAIIGL